MNSRGPISQKQFLYVGYTHLEWLLVPPGPQHTTHSYWRSPMKYRTYFIGHMLFIFIYPLQLYFFFLSLSLSSQFLILVLSFIFSPILHSSCTGIGGGKWKRISPFIELFIYFWLSLSGPLFLSLSLWTDRQKLWHHSHSLEGLLVEEKDKGSEWEKCRKRECVLKVHRET